MVEVQIGRKCFGERDEEASNALAKTLTSFRVAGQLQQRPASREGELLKKEWWRFRSDVSVLASVMRKPRTRSPKHLRRSVSPVSCSNDPRPGRGSCSRRNGGGSDRT